MVIREVLSEILAKVAKEQGYKNYIITAKQLSSGGASYTSYIYKACISAPTKEELKLFVKVAAAGEKMRSIVPLRIYNIESFVYNKLLKTYKELEEKHNVPKDHRLATPKFYASSEEYLREALVLEDLTASGYTTYDRLKSIDWEYASKSVQNLAKFHALSIAWSVEDPEEFENTDKISMNNDNTNGIIMAYLSRVLSIAVAVTREENKDRLSKFAKEVLHDKNYMVAAYRPMRRPVIAHCDYKPSNFMHKFNKDGTLDIISIDYQTIQRGNPVLDLLNLIFTGSDKSFRDQHYKQTLECYYKELCAALRRLSLDPDYLYPREDFEYELEKILPVGLTTAMYGLLLVTVDHKDAPKTGKDFDITQFSNIKPSTLYKKRLNEIVDDFIEMGVL